MDLTKLTTPFGLLDAETQAALKAHGGPYEIYGGFGWGETALPSFNVTAVYRVKPAPPKPREYWIVEWGRDWEARTSCTSAEGAAEYASDKRDARVTHVREVIPE